MSFTIRTFRNSDTPQLCSVWNRHTQVFDSRAPLNVQTFELSVLAKPYFDAQHLFVAEVEGSIVGFAHLGFAPHKDLMDSCLQQAVLSAMAVLKHDSEAAIAGDLLQCISHSALAAEAKTIETMLLLPWAPFYIGVGKGDSIQGVVAEDNRLNQWLNQAGFQPRVATMLWELDLVTFHPPMDRQQIQIRRNAHVDRCLDEPTYPWRLACQMGHTEQISFDLVHRVRNEVICRALFWTIDHSLIPSPQQIARLWWPDSISPELVDFYTFLLSDAFRQLALDRFDVVRAILVADDPATKILERLGFQNRGSGRVLAKALSAEK